MRQRRWGSVYTRKRAYRDPHHCRNCGTKNPSDFYRNYKSICKICRKLEKLGYHKVPAIHQ